MTTAERPFEPQGPHVRPRLLAVIVILVLAAGGVYVSLRGAVRKPGENPVTPTVEPPAFAPPTLSKTRFLNTAADARYIGNQACAQCHEDQFASYTLTAHSRALSRIDPSVEPLGKDFFHAASKRSYQIYREGGELRQRESLEDNQGTIASQDFAVDWLIGSGRHSRSYLVEIDGFLVESPVTWYSSREHWSVSPGYDHAHHWGFERAADEGCLVCHAGLAVPEGDSTSRIDIRQQAISCERCHGPGSLHAERWRHGRGESDIHRKSADLADGDPTIVHPGQLNRDLAEDVCAQCHLRGDATVAIRGHRVADFRPGMPLDEVRTDYVLMADDREMKVVGHVDQMRTSQCWQADGSTLTCTTCHDPHRDTLPQDKLNFYRDKCLTCHTPQSCGLPESSPRRTQVQDNCNGCHMPQVETDIPHIAFTHHRIGVHSKAATEHLDPAKAELVPISSAEQLPKIDRERNLGLAYLELSEKQKTRRAASEFRRRARELLVSVRRQGLYDGDVEAALARILWQADPRAAAGVAQSALSAPTQTPQSRVNSLFIIADAAMQEGNFQAAAQTLDILVTLRRHSHDHYLLAMAKAELGMLDAAIEHAKDAIEIHPFRAEFYQFLSRACQAAGRQDDAARFANLAERMLKLQSVEPAKQSLN
jgi:hypothetical protein